MSRRTAAWLAWSLWALSVVLAGPGILTWLAFPASAGGGPDPPPVLLLVLFLLPALLAFPTVGALVASRRPEHPIGWLFSLVGVSLGATLASIAYGHYALVGRPGSLPAGAVVLATTNSLFNTGGIAALLAFLLFPTGRLPSPSWRFAPWLVVLGFALSAVGWALQPGPLATSSPVPVENPFGLRGAEPVLAVMQNLGDLLTLLSVLVVASALVVRFRHAPGVERQQLKWFTYAIGFMAGGFLIMSVSVMVGAPRYVVDLLWGIGLLGFGLVPVAAGIAILRYRLYEIDLLINRTLVYGSLTAVLALVYVASVALLQHVLRPLLGQGNELAIIASTLAIAALFTPLRHRIQAFIDRRFYRRKYDAARVLAAFSARLRDETDVDQVADAVLTVVRETMQPTHISLWLRPPARPRPAPPEQAGP